MAAYHFSWVWVLIPMLFFGDSQYKDYLFIYAIVMGLNLSHRHFGIPYAYLDHDVFRNHQRQLTYFPLIAMGLMLATPLLLTKSISGTWGRTFVQAAVFFSLMWNFWHVYMQKFGIMRVYMAKDPAPLERKTPGWVDKLFLFCWFPLYFSYLGPENKSLIFKNGPSVRPYMAPIIAFMEEHQALFLVPSALAAAGGVGTWLWYEWRTHRFTNRARISSGAGMLLLSTALFWLDPVKVYIAFGFSHSIEYMTFVWAFQRRRYHKPMPEPTVMEKLLSKPVLFYALMIAVPAAIAILNTIWGREIFAGERPIRIMGLSGGQWYFYYAVYESLVHFYMDGFLWKIRRPEVRANL